MKNKSWAIHKCHPKFGLPGIAHVEYVVIVINMELMRAFLYYTDDPVQEAFVDHEPIRNPKLESIRASCAALAAREGTGDIDRLMLAVDELVRQLR